MKSWKWYVYIIECLDGLYYTGITYNLEKRMDQHQSGKGSAFTARHGFKCLRYYEEFNNLIEAREREHQLKDFSRKKKEALWQDKQFSSGLSNHNIADIVRGSDRELETT